MTFLNPVALWGLFALPVIVAIYALVSLRRRSAGSGVFQAKVAAGHSARPGRRHIPAGIFLAALAVLLVSFARPEANISLPVRTGQIVLVVDTSNSMVADDVEPTRLDVAKQAALDVVDSQPSSVQIGVVSFTDGGLVVQAPTSNQQDVRNAIERLSPDGGTSIGEGIFAALTAIADDPIDLESAGDLRTLDVGSFSNAAIIVFTDGEEIGGADPLDLAEVASNAGVPVYTVGIGTERGTVVTLDGFSIATALDEQLLGEIAESTGGEFFLAQDDPMLTGIFDAIDRSFERQGERIEITSLFALGAMALMIGAATMSLRWFGRI